MGNVIAVYLWLDFGFLLFFGIEQFLHWHHSHTHTHLQFNSTQQHPNTSMVLQQREGPRIQAPSLDDEPISASKDTTTVSIDVEAPQGAQSETYVHPNPPLSWLILLADGLHNLIGGMFVGAAFIDSIELGLSAWLAAAAHEVPQEIGDFAILIHGGWSKRKALLLNFISALTFPLGGLIAYAASKSLNVTFLIPFAAGNFLYIGASDLIPEVKHHGAKEGVINFFSFTAGLAILLGIRVAINGW
mmetsp:Transcript_34386/g.72447  ORF Transcript_34386/g.72447 Transcript_34386/m.72447 type:complete len:245 (-) Transcript_34386:380-1114(-)